MLYYENGLILELTRRSPTLSYFCALEWWKTKTLKIKWVKGDTEAFRMNIHQVPMALVWVVLEFGASLVDHR